MYAQLTKHVDIFFEWPANILEHCNGNYGQSAHIGTTS